MEGCNPVSADAGAGMQWMSHQHLQPAAPTGHHDNGGEITGMSSEQQERRPTGEGGVGSASDGTSSSPKDGSMVMYDQQQLQHSAYAFQNHHPSSSYSMAYHNHASGGYGMYSHQQQQSFHHPSMVNTSYQQHYHGDVGGFRHGGNMEYGGSNGYAHGGGGVPGPSPTNQASSSTETHSQTSSSNRPSPSADGGGIFQAGANPSSFSVPPHHSDYQQQYHHPQFSMNSQSASFYAAGAGKPTSNPGAQASSSFTSNYHDHAGGSAQYYYNYSQGPAQSISSRPGSQQSIDMPGSTGYSSRPDSAASFSHPMMSASGYYHHPSTGSQGYPHQQQLNASMSYHHYHQGHMAAFPQPQYSHQQSGHSQYHPNMMPHSGTTTPSSLMAGVSFDDATTKSQQPHQQPHQQHNHHAATLGTSFSSELDDSSRTSSPSGIPAPPRKIHRVSAPMSAPAKIRIPVATRPQDRADAIGPLRESSQRLNVLQESTSMDSVEESATRNDQEQSTGGIKPPATGVEPGSCPDEKRSGTAVNSTKPTSMHDASLLLGLRTSCSGSPATLPTVTDETLVTHEHSDDEDATLSGADGTRPLMHEPEDFVPYIPMDYPTRLARPQDRSMLNSLHCYIRSNLLEVFVVEKTKVTTPNLSPSTSLGRVGLRCVYCAEQRKRNGSASNTEAPMAIFYPKAVKDIYRMVTSWQRCHLRKCRNLPPAVRSEWDELREHDKSRGKTVFWLTSAREIGLVDCPSRAGGVRFARPPSDLSAPAVESTPARPEITATESV